MTLAETGRLELPWSVAQTCGDSTRVGGPGQRGDDDATCPRPRASSRLLSTIPPTAKQDEGLGQITLPRRAGVHRHSRAVASWSRTEGTLLPLLPVCGPPGPPGPYGRPTHSERVGWVSRSGRVAAYQPPGSDRERLCPPLHLGTTVLTQRLGGSAGQRLISGEQPFQHLLIGKAVVPQQRECAG